MLPVKKCKTCNASIHFSRPQFCDWRCFLEWRRRSRKDRRCEYCNAELPLEKYRHQRFCNTRCSAALRAVNMTAEARQKQRDLLSRLREQPDFRAKHLAYSASEKNRNRLIEVGRRGVEACRLRGFPTLIRRGATTPAEPTIPQKILFNALPASIMEFPVREGIKGVGWQIDLALTPFKLAIEIDGDSHKNPKARENDRKKDQTLQDRGWTVLRFWNKEILRDLPSVLSRIEATIALLKTKGAKHVVAS